MSEETIELRDDDSEIDLRDEINLQDRLRFAAGSLAADFSGELTIALAEELIFDSAEGLLAAASVTDFVPILAERRARRVVRSSRASAATTLPAPSTPPAPETSPPPTPLPPALSRPPAPAPAVPAAPLLALPEETLNRLRDGVEQVRKRVADLTGR